MPIPSTLRRCTSRGGKNPAVTASNVTRQCFIRGGSYGGWSPVVDLSSFLPEVEDPELPEVPGLENAVCLGPGRNERTVVAGFLDPLTHHLSTLEIEVLPQVLGNMADEARAYLIVSGITAPTLADLAQATVDNMIEHGGEFHEVALAYMAEEVRKVIESSEDELTDDTIASMADEVRAIIIVSGSRFGADGLANTSDSQILEVSLTADGEGPTQYVKVSAVSDRVAPEVNGIAELILSESGRGVIVKWETETHVYYRQSEDDGWTEVRAIELTESLDRDQVHRMLEDFVRAE